MFRCETDMVVNRRLFAFAVRRLLFRGVEYGIEDETD